MHQTFYIDISEEISSVIDRLKKSMAKDNYFVVPQRALFMQSVVNLKLLKREADKIGKQVVLVTQDEIGMSMAQRAGINTRLSLEGLESDPDDQQKIIKGSESKDKNLYIEKNVPSNIISQEKQIRLNSIGSNDFYDSFESFDIKDKNKTYAKNDSKKIAVNSVSYNPVAVEDAKKSDAGSFLRQENFYNNVQKNKESRFFAYGYSKENSQDIMTPKTAETKKEVSYKEKKIEKIFSPHSNENSRMPAKPAVKIGKKSKKIFFSFIVLCFLVPISVAGYLFIPSAKITIVPNIFKEKTDFNVNISNSSQAGEENIPVRVIDKTEEISLKYDVTGKSDSSGKKAHGSVVLYNEYSASSQTLIATTRLESPDGKVFRLTKNVVVPGTTMVGGSLQPGAIETEVIADQPGSEYNIDQTKFSIPGFSGGPKFDKFYAKSSVSMTGGSSDGNEKPSVISQQDMDNAKIKTEEAIKEKIREIIGNEIRAGEKYLPEAEKITITKSSSDAKVGDTASSFNYNVQCSSRALVFSESGIREMILKSLDNQSQNPELNKKISKIEYDNIEADFDNSAIKLRVFGEVNMAPDVEIEKIKKEILGKNYDEFRDVLRKYPSVKNANIELWPSFVSRVSQYSKRVDVQVDVADN